MTKRPLALNVEEPVLGGEITVLLKQWAAGDQAALDRLIPVVYNELLVLARRYVRNEKVGRPRLRTTTLVHEAYLHLVDIRNVNWQNRAHFFAISAQAMRRILVDAARARRCKKRRAEMQQESASGLANMSEVPDPTRMRDREVIAVDEALKELAQLDPRKAKVIELRFFGGLSVKETAEVLGISPQSVLRDWKLAKAWLKRELGRPCGV
jgi:RNA polymerase sigma-70 factor (ECF subfamily)